MKTGFLTETRPSSLKCARPTSKQCFSTSVISQLGQKNKEQEVQNYRCQKLFGPLVVLATMFFSGIASAQNTYFFVSTGNTDRKLGALSRPASAGKLETETADDFVLNQTTVITGATIIGLISPATPLADITNVEVEFYHRFPTDSANPDPLAGNVPSRTNSPSDVEIDTATRDGSLGTLRFAVRLLNANSSVPESVLNGIKKKPEDPTTHGDGPATGEGVEMGSTFTN